MLFWSLQNREPELCQNEHSLPAWLLPGEGGQGHALGLLGAGGKTTMLRFIARFRAERGMSVFAGTTTKIQALPGLLDSFDKAREALEQKKFSPVLAAKAIPGTGKYASFAEEENALLHGLADSSVWEADGAHALPLKFPAAYEPVIYPWFTELLLIFGLRSLGQKACEAVHRLELSPLAETPGQIIGVKEIAALILRGYAERYPGISVCLHQADGPEERQAALEIARLLRQENPGIEVYASSFTPKHLGGLE